MARSSTKPAARTDDALVSRSFATPSELEQWLELHHATEKELWICMFKKASGTPSVAWNDCVVAALAWGWIDGQRKAKDEVSFLQRFTPRRARSTWSKRNCEIAERLIAEGRMRPAGLLHVEAARSDGRWDAAYAGSADMALPDDFLVALRESRAATKTFDTLDRANLFAIYHRLQTARTVQTRTKRIHDIVALLAAGKRLH